MNILSCNHQQVTTNVQYFSSVNEITDAIWQQLGCTQNLYFNPKYLEAIQQCNEQIYCSYVVLFNNNQQAIAFATIQVVDFYLDSVQNDMQSVIEWFKCMGRKLHLLSPEKPFKILTCGNTFVSGEHGIFIEQTQDKKQVVDELAKAIVQYAKTTLNNSVDAFMMKDFRNDSLFITDTLKEENYYSFNVEPNMILKLEAHWTNFEDYLAAMKTKFRVKAKRAIKQSDSLRIENITIDSIDELLPKMTSLYKTVSTKASFNLGDFNLDTYKHLKQNLGDAYIIRAYFLHDNLVGFMSGILNKDTLDAHFVGIDYAFNKTYAIYQRMLYDYVILGIQEKVSYINFGRTASEIKSSVGAIPQDLTIYLRHKKTIPNKFLRLFLNKIKPTEFKLNMPFKESQLIEKA